jgi:hypothetical protein
MLISCSEIKKGSGSLSLRVSLCGTMVKGNDDGGWSSDNVML